MLEVSLHMSIAYSTRAFQSGYPQCRHLERRLPVSGLEWGASCHPERSEGSLPTASQILRCAQDDRHSLQTSALNVKIGDLIVSEQDQQKRVSYNHPVARSLLSARATPS